MKHLSTLMSLFITINFIVMGGILRSERFGHNVPKGIAILDGTSGEICAQL